MRVFVTGGSGFLGGYLIPRLVAQGYEVVALARSDAAHKQVEKLGAIGVRGDLTDVESLKRGVQGCDVVVHGAAAFEMWGDESWFYTMNVQGTDNLLLAAQHNTVRRFIYISAASVVSNPQGAHLVDETYQPAQPPQDAYSRTKRMAEQHMLAANSPHLTTLALRPPLIWGQGHSMSAAMREAVDQGRWVWIGGGRHLLATVHVENLCAAVIASLQKGRGGEVYYITDGETRTVRQFLTAWMNADGVQPGARSVPRWMAALSAAVLARLWRMLGLRTTPPLTPSMVAMLGTELSMTDQKARRELEYTNVLSIDEGLRLLRAAQPDDSTAHSRPTLTTVNL
ncbi:MAG: NAD-dependent epimerase/dehydratase family protein [Anaerolineae bacterium]